MGAVSVDPVPAGFDGAPAPGEGLRERKKRMMRQLIFEYIARSAGVSFNGLIAWFMTCLLC